MTDHQRPPIAGSPAPGSDEPSEAPEQERPNTPFPPWTPPFPDDEEI